MSKGTKKLDKALLVAMAAVLPVENDRMGKETGEPYASSEVVLDEARRVMVLAGLSHTPLGFEVGRLGQRDCQVLVLVIKHVKSGQCRTYRGPRYAADVTKSPAFEAGGVAKGSLRSLLQAIFLITAESPPRAIEAPPKTELHDRNQRPGLSASDPQVDEARIEEIHNGICVMMKRAPQRDVNHARASLSEARYVGDYEAIRDILRDAINKDDDVQAAGRGSAPSPGIGSLPADLADLGFSVRTTKAIERLGVNSLHELSRLSPADITKVQCAGRVTVNEIRVKLSAVGLSLSEDPPEPDDSPTPMEVALGMLPPIGEKTANEQPRRMVTWDGTKCLEAWGGDCEGGFCKSCGFCGAHAYEANRQGEGACVECKEIKPEPREGDVKEQPDGFPVIDKIREREDAMEEGKARRARKRRRKKKQPEDVTPCPEAIEVGNGKKPTKQSVLDPVPLSLDFHTDLVPCPSCKGIARCSTSGTCGGSREVTREAWAEIMARPYVDPEGAKRDKVTAEMVEAREGVSSEFLGGLEDDSDECGF